MKKTAPGLQAGQMAHFSGTSVGSTYFSGDADVKVINPHSNAHLVTSTDNSGRQYEGGSRHLATATVERPARAGAFPSPAKQFEAHVHTLAPKPSLAGDAAKAAAHIQQHHGGGPGQNNWAKFDAEHPKR